MMMKALLCREFGPPERLVLAEVPDPSPGPGQVLIDVRACAVSFPDLLMIQDKYQYKPTLPFSPGGEVAGVVAGLGEGVLGLEIGAPVLASTVSGGLAEKVVAEASSTMPVPDGMDMVTASAFLYAYGTSQHALCDRARLQAGETVLVLGAAGGVGLAAVEIAGALGARVLAAASSLEKLELCRQAGANELIDYEHEDLRSRVKELTQGQGVDVVYDPVGGRFSEPALRSMAWDGRYLVVGFAAGDIPRVPLNLPLLKGCAVVGVFWGAFVRRHPDQHRRNVEQMVGWWKEGRIAPRVSSVYPLERAGEALEELAARRAKGKVVVVMDRDRSA